MKIKIDKSVFQAYPKFKVACVLVKNLQNKHRLEEARHLVHSIAMLQSQIYVKDSKKTQGLLSPWVAARQAYGNRARHYQTSVEQLLKKVTRKKSITALDTLTNLLRFVMLEHIIPGGAEDLAKIDGDLHYTITARKTSFDRLRSVPSGILVLRDDKQILATKLDFVHHSKTRVGPKTTMALIHFEILPPVTKIQMKSILVQIKQLLEDFCGATTTSFVLDRKTSLKKVA